MTIICVGGPLLHAETAGLLVLISSGGALWCDNRMYVLGNRRIDMEMQDGGVRAQGAGSYPGSMDESMDGERAALVALLRTRPGGMRWPEIATEVLEAGSALDLWHRLVPATLISTPGVPDALEAAAQDMGGWTGQGNTLITILDSDYPVRLRGIHQAPPVLFARGTLMADDTAVSVVGSRKASDPIPRVNR
jgi:DNA recombination-mediator protein A